MIIIKYEKRENGFGLWITGHAKYAEEGKDIVCAAVSALYYAITNYCIQSAQRCDYEADPGDSYVIAYGLDMEVFKAILTGLEVISEQYKDYVLLKEITTREPVENIEW